MLRLIRATSSALYSNTSRSLRARAVRVFNGRISKAASRSRSLCSDKRAEHTHDHKCNHANHIHEASTSTQHEFLRQTIDQDLRKHRYVHFYTYKGLKNMNLVRKTKKQFLEEWGKLGVLGRVYVALEGINAQISVPIVNLEAFKTLVQNTEVLKNVRVYEGDEVDSHSEGFPFDELAVRIKKLIVADHFPEQPEDLSQTGTALEPDQWDKELANNKDTLIVDCRNYYESEIGLFEGAKRLKIDRHKESIAAIEELLEMNQINAESNKNLMIYCTGGIRCEKIGAHLVQNKGLKNVIRLEGGINNYFKQLQQKQMQGQDINSRFIGKNFVFDNRMRTGNKGLTVTPHVIIGKCHTCGAPCDEHSNCINPICNLILLQCPQCSSKLQGACSPECAETAKLPAEKLQEMKVKASKEGKMFSRSFEIVQERKLQKKSSADIPSEIVYPKIEHYCEQHTTVASPALDFITKKTLERYSFAAHMMVGSVVGQFLKTLARATNATKVLEIGTFTGYSAVCLAEGLKDGGKIITCDMDKEAVDIAREAFKLSRSGDKIETRVNTAMKSLEEIAQQNEGPFDLIFVDADRKNNKAYYNFILEHNLLAPNGVLLVDNMLWRGKVVAEDASDEHAVVVKEFTEFVHQDPRTENVLLSIRDGMLMVTLNKST